MKPGRGKYRTERELYNEIRALRAEIERLRDRLSASERDRRELRVRIGQHRASPWTFLPWKGYAS